MATERKAEVVWQGDLLTGGGTIEQRHERRLRPARRLVGGALGGAERQDEPGGADRRGVGLLLLDGALGRPRQGRQRRPSGSTPPRR